MRITVAVCDVCEDKDKPVKSYRLISEGRTKELDLCEDDGAPIEKFLEGARARGGARAGRATNTGARRSRGTSRTATLEEINANKATANA